MANSTINFNIMDTYLHNQSSNLTENTSTSTKMLSPYVILYVATMGFASCIGIIGNLFIIGAIAVNKKLHILSNIFIINLAIADLLVTGLVLPGGIVGNLNKEFLLRNFVLCQMLAAILIISCGCSLWTITGIALNRYIAICHSKIYHTLYSQRTMPFIIAFQWLMGFLIDAPNIFGWGEHGYDEQGQICTYIYTKSYTYTLYLIIGGTVIPMFVVPFCYFRIYFLVRKSSRQLEHNSESVVFNRSNPDVQTLKVVFTIWLVFMTMWSPYTIYVLFDFNGEWPSWLYILVSSIAFWNSSINFMIYGIMNTNFRKSYYYLLTKIFWCCHKKEKTLTSSKITSTNEFRHAVNNKIPGNKNPYEVSGI